MDRARPLTADAAGGGGGTSDRVREQSRYLRGNRPDAPGRPESVPSETKNIERQGHSMTDLVERYLGVWNETDASARRALIEELYTADATYLDPLGEARGRDAIDATIAAVHTQFPGFVFTPAGPADAHHSLTRFGWGLGPSDAEPVVLGFDVTITDEHGRITSVLGFLDRVPS
jgi:hypothetical protein